MKGTSPPASPYKSRQGYRTRRKGPSSQTEAKEIEEEKTEGSRSGDRIKPRTLVDPYGQYHKKAYGTRPAENEAHIVIEYRELVPTLDRDMVKKIKFGVYNDLSRASRQSKINALESEKNDADDAAIAKAAALSAAAALCAANKSGELVDRLKNEDFYAQIEAMRQSGKESSTLQDRFGVDPVCLLPPNDNPDDDPMTDARPTMANTKLSFRIHRHRSQIPQDFLDLQRHFIAQHPMQHLPLSIERQNGTTILPSDKNFTHGEYIIFREYTINPRHEPRRQLFSERPTPNDWNAKMPPLPFPGNRFFAPFDWERSYAEWAVQDHSLAARPPTPQKPSSRTKTKKKMPNKQLATSSPKLTARRRHQQGVQIASKANAAKRLPASMQSAASSMNDSTDPGTNPSPAMLSPHASSASIASFLDDDSVATTIPTDTITEKASTYTTIAEAQIVA